MDCTAMFDPEEIRRACKELFPPNQVFECRVLDGVTSGDRRPQILSGYFNDADKLVAAMASVNSAKGIYTTLNPTNPALLARAENRIRPAGKDPTTSDRDIVARRWLPIDIDPGVAAGISATDAEHNATIELAYLVRETLAAEGWPEPIIADSGNGAHVLYAIDLPADDGGLVQRVLESLAGRFGDKIDTSVHNPARIWKLYGTLACKGDSTAERPHRMSKILEAPANVIPVNADQLTKLAGAKVALMPAVTPATPIGTTFDIDAWIQRHGLEVDSAEPWQGGRKWVFRVCPWNPDHTNRSACLLQHASGAISASCRHNGCQGNNWQKLRAMFEPDRQHVRTTTVISTEPWPTPKPLPDLLAVDPFKLEMLPETLRPWLADISDRMQCPPDFPAVAAVVTMAALVGRKVGIRPKRRDDWLVVPNLWGGIVARPSLLKTPALAEPMKMLRRLEANAREEYERAVREYEAVKLIGKAREKKMLADIAAAAAKGGDAQAMARQHLDAEQVEPRRKRYIINDSTVEKTGELLNDSPNGVLNFRDELVGLLRNLDKQGQESARAFYLEAWNGNGSFTYDRIGRGTLDIKACCLSVLGGIQPGPLREYLADVARGGKGDDGLLQRFQILVWPDVSGAWRNVDRWPDTTAKAAAWEVYQRLDALTPETAGAQGGDDDDVPAVSFGSAAQDMFDAWRGELEHRLRRDGESDALLAHLGKYRSLVPSLALLFHLADCDTGKPVGVPAIERAIRWAKYLETHARRLYGAVANPMHAPARAMAKRIVAGDLSSGFTLRDVYRPAWSNLATPELAASAAELLITLGWLREVEHRGNGRPSTTYTINPAILNSGAPEVTDKTDETLAVETSVSFGSAGPDINSELAEASGSFVSDPGGISSVIASATELEMGGHAEWSA